MVTQSDTVGHLLNRLKFNQLKFSIALHKILNTGKYVNTVFSESKD